ncbi:MAG TPA: hypothetical protein VIF57_16380 [Polyangia bacterium]|jgi:hypothetical protein
MSRGLTGIALTIMIAAFAGGGCARKPAQKAEAGQVAAPPATAATPAAPAPTPTTAEGCKACNGVFGQHGIDPNPKCLCRTKDGGKTCRGKDDCEAECVADGGEREVTQPGPPQLGFRIGRCAEFRATFGCHVFLPPKSGQPVRLDDDPQQLCVD